MAAAVEEMAYVGETPWHGLGVPVEEGIPLEEFQQKAGLDWEVKKYIVTYANNVELYPEKFYYPDKFVLARDRDYLPYAIVSDRYKPVQPKEVFGFFRDLLDRYGMRMHTAGSLMDGRRIWCLAKTGDAHKVLGRDQVDSYLLLCTSYDCSMSTLAQFTSVRVVCNNTLQQAVGETNGQVKIPHFRDFDAEAVKNQLGIGLEQWSAFTRMLETLAKVKVDAQVATTVIEKVMDVANDPEKKDPNRKHASNVIDLFTRQAYVGADLAGDSAWGLLNCVTEYYDWRKRARTQATRLDGAWFGEGARIKQTAMNELLQLAA
jgi:phage/plasmid-like protein (TIGR03299 family)